ncbi:MAG TPA: LL-diaminopimelate aminotransferase [bacterium]|nr:LL-diaminopimelate aminotransferase [bacterium]HPP29540.1 LL-diaminopimelate aminotransferase [bacterium]
MFEVSKRLKKLPPYLFAEIDRKKKKLISEGVNIIDFGIGDPDLPTPENIVEAMKKGVGNSSFHRYPLGKGTPAFRKAIADFYKNNYEVKLNPDEEIVVLIGSKEGIAHFPWAILNPGDISLVPEPGYPVYHIGTILAEGQPYFMPLKVENKFLPELNKIPQDILNKARILFLNYPNNPTSTFIKKDFLIEAINFCKKNEIILVYDAAYSEIYFNRKPVSFLSLPGAKEVGIEFHSLSKTYNMTGWRIGWVCGNRELVSALAKIKENIDSGTFEAIQFAGIEALTGSQESVKKLRTIYKNRMHLLVEGLKECGFNINMPEGTFYCWVKIEGSSIETAGYLLEKAGIVATPGIGFGPSGEGYLRFSITVPEEKIKEGIRRMKEIWLKK